MKTRNIYFTIVLFFFLVTFSSLYSKNKTLSTPLWGAWELGVKAMNSGSAISVSVKVYTFNTAARNLELYASGSTTSSGFPNNDANGWADIGDNNSDGSMFSLPAGGQYYIRIEDKFMIITFTSGSAYGDMKFIYQNGSISLDYNTSNYDITGPYTWSEKTIALANDFGSDKTSCYGNIHLNSVTLTNVGISSTTQTREAVTFPHTIAGEDNQYVNYAYRKWRNWDDNTTSISKTLSYADNYNLKAIYAKQVNATLTNNFGGGIINVNSTPYNSGSTAHLYDDMNYTITAPYQTVNWIDFIFDHWSGSYNGTQNPLTYNNPSSNIDDLTAHYTGTANQSPMNIHYTSSNGEYISLAWTEHPSNDVTQYQVWRAVTGGSTSAIATLNRGTTSYTDYTYIQNPNGVTKLFYTVKAYYSPSGTWNDPAYILNRGDIDFNIAQDNDQLNVLDIELPTSYLIANYPNPFNPTTTINYQLPENGFVTFKVYDLLGKEVATLVNENKSAGYHRINFDASKLTSGVYIYTININNFVQSKKMLLMK